MEDVIWRITRQSHDLQDLRLEIRGLWDDEAAREINSRHLNPHETESEELHHALGQQHLALQEAENRLNQIGDLARLAYQLAEQVAQILQMIDQESRNAHARYEQYAENHAAARSLLPIVYEEIKKANQSCS
ncbi:MAG: hypothetical protein KF893_09980 [Caldilineaceae bacterium]|nr:hypothetical protein [Caldilineaceae bacterium]